MKKRRLILGDYDTAEDGLFTLSACKITKGSQVQSFVSVPGRYAPIDTSTLLTDGQPYYGSAALDATLESSEGTRDERLARVSGMVNALDGRSMRITHPDHPERYLVGRVQVRPEYNDPAHSAVRVSAVCEPWLYNAQETEVQANLPHAEIHKIGGVTYKDGDTLRSAPVSKVESIGGNLATPQEVYANTNRYLETTLDGRAVVRFCAANTIKNEVLKFKENTQYTISGWFKNVKTSDGNSTPNAYASFFYSDGTSTSGTMGQNTDWSHYAFTSTAGKTVVAVGTASYNYTSDVYVDVNTFMLNEGAEALPYSPHPYAVLPIPEAVQALDGYGDGVSESVYNYIGFEAKQFVKRVGKVVFDGSSDEWWGATPAHNTADYNAFYIRQYATNSHKTAGGVALCDKLLNRLYSQWYNNNVDGFYLGDATDKQIIVRVPNIITTAAEMRAWLAENPLTIYYELATPEVTDISDLLSGVNTIPAEEGGTLTMVNPYGYEVPHEVTYYLDGESPQQVELVNAGRLAVVPVVTVKGEVTLSYGNITQTLSTGTYTLPWLYLTPDKGPLLPASHIVTCSGGGSVTFTYREAVLAE